MTGSALAHLLSTDRMHVHMIGIGGVGMAALARILQGRGCIVQGTDLEENRFTQGLREEGVSIQIGHRADAVAPQTALCIYSTAIHEGHVERVACRQRGILSCPRGEAFAAIASGAGSIAVTGTHGKTSTTAMLRHILVSMNLPCDYFIGAEGVGGEFYTAYDRHPLFVFEADESDGTLIHYRPEHAIITNIDYDHMEHHKDEAAFFTMFERFADQVQGEIVINSTCSGTRRLFQDRPGVTRFGLQDSSAEVSGSQVISTSTRVEFSLSISGKDHGRVFLPVSGEHMAENALAALAMMYRLGLDVSGAVDSLSTFQPVKRRMECLYDEQGVQIFTDYAHHPTELEAVLKVLETYSADRLILVFQPHRYTRTAALMDDFVRVLSGSFDLYLAPVFAASELPLEDGTSEGLAEKLKQAGQKVVFVDDMEVLVDDVLSNTASGDLIAFLGAGDLDGVVRRWISSHLNRKEKPYA